jgi:hypothetical protein
LRRLHRLAFILVLVVSAPAWAGTLDLGETTIEVTSFDVLDSVVDITPIAPGEVGVLFDRVFTQFPVTAVDLGAGTIDHAGGLLLSAGEDSLQLGNFQIDLGASTVFAQVGGVGDSTFALFEIRDCANLGTCTTLDDKIIIDGLGLFFTEQAAGAVGKTFGVDVGAALPSGQFGVANSAIRTVPEASMAVLLGLGLMATSLRRRI